MEPQNILNPLQDFQRRRAAERLPAGHQLIEDRAEREDVAACVNGLPGWKLAIVHTCKEYPGAQLRSARCCSSRPAQKEDRKCNPRNLKSRSRPSKRSSAGASLESAVSSSNPPIVIRCANGIRSILDSLTKAKARCFRGANTTTRKGTRY